MDELTEYLGQLEKNGYIANDRHPLKCLKCDHTDFKMENAYYDHMGLVEYSLKCEHCGEIVGDWAYGYWRV